jgi:hypothetical protein
MQTFLFTQLRVSGSTETQRLDAISTLKAQIKVYFYKMSDKNNGLIAVTLTGKRVSIPSLNIHSLQS